MTLRNRLDTLEGNLTPKELIIRWMAEAHQFGNFTAYGLWLFDQPEAAYPLVRLPRHLDVGTKQQMKGQKEAQIAATLSVRQRDLLFLFHLHSQLNDRVTFTLNELRWRVLFLAEQLRHFLDLDALEEEQAGLLRRIPGRKPRVPQRDRARDQEKLQTWRALAEALDEDVRDLLGAAECLSTRYFSGEDLLYPQARASLLQILLVLFRQQRLQALGYGTREESQHAADTLDEPFVLGPLSANGRNLAVELVALAKAQALALLGEQNAGIRLVQEWLRETCR